MNARELNNQMNYLGMERNARKLLIEERFLKAEEIAVMTSVEVCETILQHYDVISCSDEDIIIVKNEDMDLFDSIAKHLKR